MYNQSKILSLAEAIEQSSIIYLPELRGYDHFGQDFMYPYIVLMLCLRGSARAMYDLREVECTFLRYAGPYLTSFGVFGGFCVRVVCCITEDV